MADRFGYGEIGLDINPCRGCEDYDARDGCKSNGGCGKLITNYDRIISKTPEELAEWIAEIADHGGGRCAPGCYDCTAKTCESAWPDWLKQEANE